MVIRQFEFRATYAVKSDLYLSCKQYPVCYFLSWQLLRIWSHLLKKSLMENFIFCAVLSGQLLKLVLENEYII